MVDNGLAVVGGVLVVVVDVVTGGALDDDGAEAGCVSLEQLAIANTRALMRAARLRITRW